MTKIIITPKRVLLGLTAVVGLLAMLHGIGQVVLIHNHLQLEDQWLIRLFYFDAESSFPTLFSFFLLQYAALLLGIISYMKSRLQEPFSAHWSFLCLIFLFLSFDEILALHEHLITPTMSWTLPYLLMTLAIGMSFLRFLAHLPAPTRKLFIIAGVIYVGGAAGLEIPGGQIYAATGASWEYVVLITLEELFEMMGIVLFIYALTDYMSHSLLELTFVPYAVPVSSR